MSYPGGRLSYQGTFFERATQFELFDHFIENDCLANWNTLETDNNASVALDVDLRGGYVLLTAETDLNEECYLYSNPIFKWNGDLPMSCQTRFTASHDTANAYSWVFGFVDGAAGFGAGDLIADGGLSLLANMDLAVFFKPYNTNKISVVTAQSATGAYKTIQTEQVDPTTSGEPASFRIEVIPRADDHYEVVYFIDKEGALGFQPCTDLSTGKPIKVPMFYDPAGTLSVGMGLKNGKASETALVAMDYMGGLSTAHRNYGDS